MKKITADVSEEEEENLEKSLHFYINDIEMPVIWEQNASVEALAAFAEDEPVTSQIVIFYGSNSWTYTRLGRIPGAAPEKMAELLGNGNVTVTVSYE